MEKAVALPPVVVAGVGVEEARVEEGGAGRVEEEVTMTTAKMKQ